MLSPLAVKPSSSLAARLGYGVEPQQTLFHQLMRMHHTNKQGLTGLFPPPCAQALSCRIPVLLNEIPTSFVKNYRANRTFTSSELQVVPASAFWKDKTD